MNKKLFDALQVRFIKLRFIVAFIKDSILPRDKVSAIRGGIGEMLLRMNCVRDRKCDECDFETECIIQKIMYSKFQIKPDYVTTGGSIGYVLECENYQENFKCGEKLDFCLILFGKTIVYFSQIYQAILMLGEEGIGKYQEKYQIVDIRNFEGMSILEGKKVYMCRYVVHTLYDYLMFRRIKLTTITNKTDVMMIFDTPLTLKYRNDFLKEFQAEALIRAIKRRIFMLDCFEGIESDIMYDDNDDSIVKICSQECFMAGMSRYSARKDEKMILRGLKGHALLQGLSEELLALFIIGELIHIGKNSSFGFGRYHLKFINIEPSEM